MKKIPTLFKRLYEGPSTAHLLDEVTPGCAPVLAGLATPTIKWDGACCAIIDGQLYKRYDAKHGKIPPEGAIPCQLNPDPVTEHWPHWLKCDKSKPEDKYFIEAFKLYNDYNADIKDGTYEMVGPAVQSNPYGLDSNILIKHASVLCSNFPEQVTKDSIEKYLKENCMEGIVFWYKGQPLCKIKRKDYTLKWPAENPVIPDYFKYYIQRNWNV